MDNYTHTFPRHSNKFLLKELVKLRLLTDFKRSFLGWLWLLILPVFAILTWIFMKGAGIFEPGKMEIPYTAFVVLSTTIWALFFDSYKNCSQIFTTYGKTLLVNKLPINIIIFNELIVGIIKFLIPFIFIIGYFLFIGISVHPLVFIFPIVVLPLQLFGASIGLLTGLFSALAKDFTFLMDNFIKLFLLLSPVVYTPEISTGLLAKIITYNPLTYLISSPRNLLLKGEVYQPMISIICVLCVVTLFILLTRFFVINTKRILEREGD
ncbi:ABC transporter permease [Dokdonia ponticola]|uniref:Transport permease protein n=1 Tax=Dokdonia ponticola TaxID=2041041 RepID=A0ABV9HXT1_9FLAO